MSKIWREINTFFRSTDGVKSLFYERIVLSVLGRSAAKTCTRISRTELKDEIPQSLRSAERDPLSAKAVVAMINSTNSSRPTHTYIPLQKNGIDAKVNYYTGGTCPTHINGVKLITPHNIARLENCYKTMKNRLSNVDIFIAASFISEKTDVVYAQFGNTGAKIMDVCKEIGLPLIVHFRGADSSRKDILKKYEKKYVELFEYAAFVVVVSHDMADRLVSFGCPREKIIYNPSAPADAYYHVQPTFSKKLFLGAGRFAHKKAPQNTIRAFTKVLEKHPDAQLILAGGGKLLKLCKKIVKQNNIEKSVCFPGVYNSEQLKKWLSEAAAFVQHSMTAPSGDKEGTPNTISEASLAGLPVISTFHAGIPDVIIDGKTGLLVNEGDIDGMARNMIWVLDNPEEAKKMGSAGKENVWKNFNLKKCVGILDEIIYAAAAKQREKSSPVHE